MGLGPPRATASIPYTGRHVNSFQRLIQPLQRALADEGYSEPTPVQAEAIPPLLQGEDVLGVAQTGTGKTAAFTLPVLHQLTKHPAKRPGAIRALVLTPTRELASQVGQSVATYGKYLSLKHYVIFGGVSQGPQVRTLRRGVDVLVATPGRLLDLHQQGELSLSHVEFLVLDEADRMLDMGFIHDLKRIRALIPEQRQTLLFSATMPKSIAKLAGEFMIDPVRVEVTPQSTPVERITQQVMFTEKANKRKLLAHLLGELPIDRAIVFTRTKHGANRVVKSLDKAGFTAAAIHGNKSQNARTRALDGFKSGDIKVLVATDVASRGIDVDGISHVFNFDLPNESESYVHRIGRTGRAGREGVAISFCDDSEGGYLRDIERLTGVPLAPMMDQPFHFHGAIPDPRATSAKKKGGGRKPGGGQRKPGGGGGRRPSGNRRRPPRRR